MGQTLFDKLWRQHTVAELPDGSTLLYLDRILLHERTGSIALKSLAESGRSIHAPAQATVVIDHIVDTLPGRSDDTLMPGGGAFIRETRQAAAAAGIRVLDVDDPLQGIVHVVSPELGIAQPGLTLVCPDSHTCTQGALGALAWGIGSTDCEHALATQTLAVHKPANMRVRLDGQPAPGVTAKDIILHLIAAHGAGGGAGHAVEFAGEAVEAMSVEARMTLCNMAVEFAAWTGLCAPDQKVIDYVEGRPFAPSGEDWRRAVESWRELASDPSAAFDREIVVDVSALEPQVTWGVSPQHATGITGRAPEAGEQSVERALAYMALAPGQSLEGLPIDAAFIGSCTNSRLSDLRAAAEVLRGRKVAAGVRAICVPGSTQVKRAAEAEGLDTVFRDAGFEWRESGCSMCFFAGGEHFAERSRVISTTNRNFENRQGPSVRTHLASPVTVAASAVAGHITDPRRLTA
ncbi:MAG TPA: 3-isopropylmalate dehydratase large subunit [Caulobacteraceae bacterium]|nr:3-isopropylmalate dehydratase large subunit [Caulobacteraceae bacterium]